MYWFLIEKGYEPFRVTEQDKANIQRTYPHAEFVRADKLAEYFETKRTQMIYG